MHAVLLIKKKKKRKLSFRFPLCTFLHPRSYSRWRIRAQLRVRAAVAADVSARSQDCSRYLFRLPLISSFPLALRGANWLVWPRLQASFRAIRAASLDGLPGKCWEYLPPRGAAASYRKTVTQNGPLFILLRAFSFLSPFSVYAGDFRFFDTI